MSQRLGRAVIGGYIENHRENRVCAVIDYVDEGGPRLQLDLTGNCSDSLRGRCVSFEARGTSPGASGAWEELRGLEPAQFGVAGRVGLYRRRGCRVESAGGERVALLVEWFGQDGRVILEVERPDILVVAGPPPVAEGEPGEAHVGEGDRPGAFDTIPRGLDQFCYLQRRRRRRFPSRSVERELSAHPGESLQDPLGSVFREDLGIIELETRRLAAARGSRPPGHAAREQNRVLDEYALDGKDVPLYRIFDPPLRLLPPEELDEFLLDLALRGLLARLALKRVKLDVCEHLSPREVYTLLVRKLLVEAELHPEMPEAEIFTHLVTYEDCEACQSELED